MIKIIEHGFIFPDIGDNSVGVKIYCNYLAYGSNFGIADFWYQLIDENITAVICKIDGNMLIYAFNNADLCEILEFIRAIGLKSLQAETLITDRLFPKNKNVQNFSEYKLLKKATDYNINQNDSTSLKNCYDILFGEKNNGIAKIGFDGWYVDMSHKVRHGCAAFYNIECAAAVASHIADKNAVISGVAVKSHERNKGSGSNAVITLINSLPQSVKNIFVCCNKDVSPFYLKCGFQPTGKTISCFSILKEDF